MLAAASLLCAATLIGGETDNAINEHPNTESGFNALYGFTVFLPQDYSTSGLTYPLIVVFGGVSERGNGSSELNRLVSQGPLRKIALSTTNRDWFGINSPCIVFQWQIPSSALYNVGETEEMIAYAMSRYRVNPRRVHLTGLSLGGGQVWKYAAAMPDRLASIVPVCGASGPSNGEGAKLSMPIWAHHYAADGTVILANTSFPWCRDAAIGTGGVLTDPKYVAPTATPPPTASSFPYNPTVDYAGKPTYTGHYNVSTGWTWFNGISSSFGADRPLLTIYPLLGHGGWDEAYHLSSSSFDTYTWMLNKQRSNLDLVLDNRSKANVARTGTWTIPSALAAGFYGADYAQLPANTAGGSFTFQFAIPTTGSYAVSMRWPTATASSVPVDVVHGSGTASVTVNQAQNPNTWNSLGTWTFNAGTATVTIQANNLPQAVVADAVRFVLISGGGNTPPTIAGIAAQTVNEDTASGSIACTIGDAETAVGSLTLSRSSSNTTLVPTGNIVFAGSGANRTVRVTPAANQSGSATITVQVTDGGGLSASTSFTLTVSPVNDAPSISAIANQSIGTSSATSALACTVGDLETAAGSLTVTRTSSNTTLVPLANAVLGGSGANRTIRITPVVGLNGSSVITVTVSDGSLSASTSFTVTVSTVAAGGGSSGISASSDGGGGGGGCGAGAAVLLPGLLLGLRRRRSTIAAR